MIDLKGKTAFITGSSRGIGQQVAKGLANLGCNIIVHGRTKESTTHTAELLKAYSVDVYQVFGELSEEASVNEVIKQVKDLSVQVDIQYNNAAIMSPYRVQYWEHTWDDWMLSMKVNVFAMFSLCKAFMPSMIDQGFGRVINLTSGINGEPELAPYGATKWAVNKLTHDLSVKLADTGVRINTLDPGWLKTDLGGEYADHEVEEVLPGALAPALVEDDGANGIEFSAINHSL